MVPPSLPFDYADLDEQLDPRYLARGVDYFQHNMVTELSIRPNGKTITGKVRGSGHYNYKVNIKLSKNARGLSIDGECSCPVTYDCKHVAALLLAALEENKRTENLQKTKHSPSAKLTAQRWLEEVEHALQPEPVKDQHAPNEPRRLLYILTINEPPATHELMLNMQTARKLQKGGYGKADHYNPDNLANHGLLGFMLDTDVAITHQLHVRKQIKHLPMDRLTGADSGKILHTILQTGHCHWHDKDTPALQPGPTRAAKVSWRMDEVGNQHLELEVEPTATHILPTQPPMYLDVQQQCCGPIEMDLPETLLETLLNSPPVKPAEVSAVQKRLKALKINLPNPEKLKIIKRSAPAPTPVLILSKYTEAIDPWFSRFDEEVPAPSEPVMQLRFDYDGVEIFPGDQKKYFTLRENQTLIQQSRDLTAEKKFIKQLRKIGAIRFDEVYGEEEDAPKDSYILSGDADDEADQWLKFLVEQLPVLHDEGWRTETDEDFPYRLAEAQDWSMSLDDQPDNHWFDLELGITVDGEKVNLLPILLQLINKYPQLSKTGELPEHEYLLAPLDDGRLLPLPMNRLQHILGVLVELYDPANMKQGRLQLPDWRAAELAELTKAADNAAALRWLGGERLKQYGERLRDFKSIKPKAAPKGFKATLRPYQKDGLGWLQFLRKYDFNGLLADDMGLGKTVQTLAHILTEKLAGRAERPILVIAPTSLMHNWRHEAAQFTPQLKVLTLHGPERSQYFDQIKDHDLILSTYPLLARDESVLTSQPWHMVILDEAQFIKNSKAKVTLAAHQLKTKHRLCLTGTPMENHLGELWSLFHFLMPGLLGNEQQFRRLFRTPIENHGNTERAARLAQRVAPFMLRRNKEEVASDLPPKTEIIRTVPLEGKQRDLYESIRLTMHDKVRKAISQKGVNRSHIIILDALLKLRQVCCDPQLLKLDAAKKVKQSAKLELLMAMLPELLEEGRRILLFSQFTSMLSLIEAELHARKINYVKLTGQTRDRASPIEQFQNGEVPLFLISLKAGGTGLNLTAADTVIHYDPWWNPAVESQATDRAHRIGQDKPVFVYKLLTEGTVEERIQEMQARKRQLAEGLFAGGGKGKLPGTNEIEALFQPL